METREILEAIEAAGVKVSTDGCFLTLMPAGALADELVEIAREHEDELIVALLTPRLQAGAEWLQKREGKRDGGQFDVAFSHWEHMLGWYQLRFMRLLRKAAA